MPPATWAGTAARRKRVAGDADRAASRTSARAECATPERARRTQHRLPAAASIPRRRVGRRRRLGEAPPVLQNEER